MFLLWSNKHGMWWRPNERGYTQYLDEAGRYSFADAVQIEAKSSRDGRLFTLVDNPIPGGPAIKRFPTVIVNVATLAVPDESRTPAAETPRRPVVHLSECIPEQHPRWRKTVWREALASEGELCPETEYMLNELFSDEEVWIEVPS